MRITNCELKKYEAAGYIVYFSIIIFVLEERSKMVSMGGAWVFDFINASISLLDLLYCRAPCLVCSGVSLRRYLLFII